MPLYRYPLNGRNSPMPVGMPAHHTDRCPSPHFLPTGLSSLRGYTASPPDLCRLLPDARNMESDPSDQTALDHSVPSSECHVRYRPRYSPVCPACTGFQDYFYIMGFQLVNNVLCDNSISCKSGYRLNQDGINLPSVGIIEHPCKFRPILSHTRFSLVCIHSHKVPVRCGPDVGFVVFFL